MPQPFLVFCSINIILDSFHFNPICYDYTLLDLPAMAIVVKCDVSILVPNPRQC